MWKQEGNKTQLKIIKVITHIKIKNYRDPNKNNKLQRARILKTNHPIKMQNWKQTIMIKSTENILTDK